MTILGIKMIQFIIFNFVLFSAIIYRSNNNQKKIYKVLDRFIKNDPTAVFKVHRYFKKEFIDFPILTYSVIYVRANGNQLLETLTITFYYDVSLQKYVGKMNFKINPSEGKVETLICTSNKIPYLDKYFPFYKILAEIETTSRLPIDVYNSSAKDELDNLIFV